MPPVVLKKTYIVDASNLYTVLLFSVAIKSDAVDAKSLQTY